MKGILISTRTTLFLAAFLLASVGAASTAPARTAAPHQALAPAAHLRTHHKHQWHRSFRKTWMPPVYQKRLVGYDGKGKPIYQRLLVKKGYYKTITVMRCIKCGRIK